MGLTIGSLFAGIGGFDAAGEWCGHRTIWTSEIDPYCVALLAERFPAAKQLGDISAIDWAHVERPDIITGGFPCQDISYAGKGAGLAGKRSGLWYEYARAIREVGPRYVIVENVRALFTRGFDAVLGTLADLGYDAEWSMYGAADVGAPHRRHRVWILAYAQGANGRRELAAGREGSGWPRLAGEREGLGDTESQRPGEARGLRPYEPAQRIAGGCEGVVHPASGGRGTGASESARRADGGREGLGDAKHSGLEGLAWDGDNGHQPGRLGAVPPGSTPASCNIVGWADAVPVRGHDGTVRLIPRQAAEEGPESSLWPVADGVPGRVARLRGIGNAIVPACAVPIYGRIAELEGLRLMQEAA